MSNASKLMREFHELMAKEHGDRALSESSLDGNKVKLVFKGNDLIMVFALDLYAEMIRVHSFGSCSMGTTEDEDLVPTYTLEWMNIPEPWTAEHVVRALLSEARAIMQTA